MVLEANCYLTNNIQSRFAVVRFSAARHEAVCGDQDTWPRRTEEPRSLALDRSATAVGGDDRASDVARARRGEESDDFGDLLGVCSAVEQRGAP
jgi:hypothetical protein